MKPKFDFTKDYLKEHYIHQQKSTTQIAHEVGLASKTSVLIALRKFDIPARHNRGGGKPHANRQLVGQITKSCWYRIYQSARRRHLTVSIDRQYIWRLFQKQKGLCALTGVKLQFAALESNEHKHTQTASLDRIDSTKGYIKGNVQWVHKNIQSMKMDMSQTEFIAWCNKVSQNT